MSEALEIKQMVAVLVGALQELDKAVKELTAPVYPKVGLPRPRVIEIARGIVWPHIKGKGEVQFNAVVENGFIRYFNIVGTHEEIARAILQACRWQPAKVLRALRRIQAAAEWCRRRTEGRRRASQEILRQQSKALEILRAEAAMRALAKMGQ